MRGPGRPWPAGGRGGREWWCAAGKGRLFCVGWCREQEAGAGPGLSKAPEVAGGLHLSVSRHAGRLACVAAWLGPGRRRQCSAVSWAARRVRGLARSPREGSPPAGWQGAEIRSAGPELSRQRREQAPAARQVSGCPRASSSEGKGPACGGSWKSRCRLCEAAPCRRDARMKRRREREVKLVVSAQKM